MNFYVNFLYKFYPSAAPSKCRPVRPAPVTNPEIF